MLADKGLNAFCFINFCSYGMRIERCAIPNRATLPRGEGESSAGFAHNPALCRPNDRPEEPNLPPPVPSPRGRVALLGIAYRVIHAFRSHIPSDRRPRKGVSDNCDNT